MVAIVQAASPMALRRSDCPKHNVTNKRARTARRERCVQFEGVNQVMEIPSRRSFSPQELEGLYLSKTELRRIQIDIVHLIREFKSNETAWSGKGLEQLRGLEPLTNHDDAGRLPRLKSAVSAVMKRQMSGSIDEVWLSKEYRPYSEVAQTLALRRAEHDSLAAFSDKPRRIVMAR